MIEVVEYSPTDLDDERDFHVYPISLLEREHDCSVNCWCFPERLDDNGLIVVHRRVGSA